MLPTIEQNFWRPTRLFHGPQTRGGAMSVSNITEKWMNGILWNLQDLLDITHWEIWNILVMLRLIPWKQDFYFLGL